MELKKGFDRNGLSNEEISFLKNFTQKCRGDILKMTTAASSGHPGGSMSSIDIYSILYGFGFVYNDNPFKEDRDIILVSHGHTSPGVYSALGNYGFFNIDDAITWFRYAGSPFEGHVEKSVTGVEWDTGNLGQGLSAACGFALASKLHNYNNHIYCIMGDGEQTKGQISEARRFAVKYKLNNLTVIVDHNGLQIGGKISDIMPDNIKQNFEADGFHTFEIDGHNFDDIYKAIKKAHSINAPVAIIANTVMGKGVSFMENKAKFHGSALNIEDCKKALIELGEPDNLAEYIDRRKQEFSIRPLPAHKNNYITIKNTGNAITYTREKNIDNRSAFGNVLADIAKNYNIKIDGGKLPMAVFDCDLEGSVKTGSFRALFPDRFFESGIEEHNTATISGAISTAGILSFFADFGVFGIDEVYNQQRLNDINHTNLKVVCTHSGIDVGEDGKTHQCIDYFGLLNSIFGFKVILPADPNQTDRAIRYIASHEGNFAVIMGRSIIPVILNNDNAPAFGNNYEFKYGKMDKIIDGGDVCIISAGNMTVHAIEGAKMLQKDGIKPMLLNVSCPSDIDIEDLKIAAQTGFIITIEDHNVKTGIGTAIGSLLAENNIQTKFKKLGATFYSSSGKPSDLYKLAGLSPEGLYNAIKETL
ncbi:MAG: transketolase [Deltaproteobacteria bacterium]|nr:transketolase [Deltaproteobacteria bacterium]